MTTETVLTLKDLPLLARLLHEVAYQWHSLGIQLDFNPGILHSIGMAALNDPLRALENVLTQWLQRADPPPTLEELIEVVGGPVLTHKVLARKLLQQREEFPSVKARKAGMQHRTQVWCS